MDESGESVASRRRPRIRIGIGWDSHAFQPGVPLHIGGVRIEHPSGLAGHSDGDVLLHAITDALLGAVAAGDIGSFFPPSDPRWKGADSAVFIKTALGEVRYAGYRVVNVDTTLILAAPKIAPLAGALRERVAELLAVDVGSVSIKAKTPEGLGQDNVAQAHAAVLLETSGEERDAESLTAAEADREPQTHVDDVVRKLVDDSQADPVRGTASSKSAPPKPGAPDAPRPRGSSGVSRG